jgi:5-oxoprolinase (ATP-hydrolysing)
MAWEFWIDRGGTFTDVVGSPGWRACDPQTAVRKPRALPRCRRRRASVTCLGLGPADPIPEGAIRAVKMGTTVATNALLERKGERVASPDHRGVPRPSAHRLSGPPAGSSISNIRRPDLFYETVVRSARTARRRRRGDPPAGRKRPPRRPDALRGPKASAPSPWPSCTHG